MRRSLSSVTAPLCSLALAFVVGCGGSQPSAASPGGDAAASGTDSKPADAAASPDVWSDSLTDKQKAEFMKAKVLPAMGKVFKEHDAKAYENFDCKTCHGPQFKDPDKFLPALTIKGGKMLAMDDKPEVVKFMHDKVVPEMAALFGQKPYDPATKEGFGCAGCHEMKME